MTDPRTVPAHHPRSRLERGCAVVDDLPQMTFVAIDPRDRTLIDSDSRSLWSPHRKPRRSAAACDRRACD
jgi:hypothetical protein